MTEKEGNSREPDARRRPSPELLHELESVDRREDDLREVLLRRGERLERLIDGAQQRGRVATVGDLRPLEELLTSMKATIDDLQATIARAEAAAVPAVPAGATEIPALASGGSGEGGTERSHAARPGSPEEPTSPGAAGDGESDSLAMPSARQPTGTGSPQGPPAAGESTADPPTFEQLAAKAREHDAESDRLRALLRDRLAMLEAEAGKADAGGKVDVDEEDAPVREKPPRKKRGAYRVTSPPMRSRQILSLQQLLNRRFAKWRVYYRVKENGVYGPETHRAARRVAYGLGLPSKQIARELTPDLRDKIRDPKLRSPQERERARRRAPWRRKLRRRHSVAADPEGSKPGAKPLLKNRVAALAGRFTPGMLNGHPGNVTPACKKFIVRAVRAGLVVTSTSDLKHAPTSYHYTKPLGRAVDVAGAQKRMERFYRRELRREGRAGNQYAELFGPGRRYVKRGQFQSGQFPGHRDHVHAAPWLAQ